MKHFIFLILLFSFIFADTEIVSVQSEHKGYKAKKELKKIAQKDAIKNYILKKNKNIDSEVIEKIQKESQKFILLTTLTQLDVEDSETYATYSVEIDNETINKTLSTYGQSIQGIATDIILAELPVDLNTIEHFSKQDFLIYYESLQETIKSTINRKLNSVGLNTVDLSKNKKFANHKNYGSYYDSSKKRYVTDKKFYKDILKEYPNAIVLKYKVDSFSIKNKTMQASLSFEIDDDIDEKSINLGKLDYAIHIDDLKYNSIKNGFSLAIENIVSLISNDVNEKLSTLIETRNNKPIQILVNVASKRVAYAIKKALKNNKNILEAVVSNKQLKLLAKNIELESLLYEDLLPAIEDKINSKIPDKYIEIHNGKKVVINSDSDTFSADKIIAILYI